MSGGTKGAGNAGGGGGAGGFDEGGEGGDKDSMASRFDSFNTSCDEDDFYIFDHNQRNQPFFD